MEIFPRAIEESLTWFPELEFGYFPVKAGHSPYNQEYWHRFVSYRATPQGERITQARVEFVRKHYSGKLVDIGIGCGHFLEERQKQNDHDATFGYDVNPIGIGWLKERGRWLDPYDESVPAATFWDVLEHVLEPAELLGNISEWVFLSAPIFTGPTDVLASKHFKKDEHCWYWTPVGLERWMSHYGFSLVDSNRMESQLGRESIGTFAFRRTGSGPSRGG